MGPSTKRLYANDEKAPTSRICGILQIYYEDFRKIQEMLFAFLVEAPICFAKFIGNDHFLKLLHSRGKIRLIYKVGL